MIEEPRITVSTQDLIESLIYDEHYRQGAREERNPITQKLTWESDEAERQLTEDAKLFGFRGGAIDRVRQAGREGKPRPIVSQLNQRRP